MESAAIAKLVEKVDKIAEDTSYMRGKYDATIPDLVLKVSAHEKTLDALGREISTIQGKATVVSAISGSFMGVLVAWLYSKIN